ncbi:hypothetical protein QR680_011431 [Steinernema hermaphroditum]|uniref:Uncharacterized protein n=1 Tax=Steinernema hermaphroditum TaxID=289476 RepID=A0AA39LYZ4_9BILA|nr:hypothetical protein QR680_011431 [Steinernema hermaphroditum]
MGNKQPKRETSRNSNKDFAYLSHDIIYDIVHLTDVPTNLHQMKGVWGRTARARNKSTMYTQVFKTEDLRMIDKVPEALYGQLYLQPRLWLDSEHGKEFIERILPRFSKLCFRLSIYGGLTDFPAHFKDFLVKQLHSKCLWDLECDIDTDLEIDDDILAFCLSPQVERFLWRAPISSRVVLSIFLDLTSRNVSVNTQRRRFNCEVRKEEIAIIVNRLRLRKCVDGNRYYKRVQNETNPEMTVEIHICADTGDVFLFLQERDDRQMLAFLGGGAVALRKRMYFNVLRHREVEPENLNNEDLEEEVEKYLEPK